MYPYTPPPPPYFSPPPPPPPRKSSRGVGVAIVGLCLLGFFMLVGIVSALGGSGTKPQSASAVVASTTTTTRPVTTTTNGRDAMLAWGERSMPTMMLLKGDLDDITSAANRTDLADLRDACESLGDHASQLRRELPTPDPDMTAALSSAASDFESASTNCVSAARTLNTSSLRSAIADIESGNRHIETATGLLDRYDT